MPRKWDASQPVDGTMKQIWPPRLKHGKLAFFSIEKQELQQKPSTKVAFLFTSETSSKVGSSSGVVPIKSDAFLYGMKSAQAVEQSQL